MMRKSHIVVGALLLFVFLSINLLLSNALLDFNKSCNGISLLQPCGERKEQLALLSYVFALIGVLSVAYGFVAGRPALAQPAREKVLVRCLGCGAENAEDARFCKGCGALLRPEREKVLIRCTRCGAKNSEDAGLCGGCGSQLRPQPPLPRNRPP